MLYLLEVAVDGNNDNMNFTSTFPSLAPSASPMAQLTNPTVPSIVTPTFNANMDPPPTTLKPTNSDMNMPPINSCTSSAPIYVMTNGMIISTSPTSKSSSYYNVNCGFLRRRFRRLQLLSGWLYLP